MAAMSAASYAVVVASTFHRRSSGSEYTIGAQAVFSPWMMLIPRAPRRYATWYRPASTTPRYRSTSTRSATATTMNANRWGTAGPPSRRPALTADHAAGRVTRSGTNTPATTAPAVVPISSPARYAVGVR